MATIHFSESLTRYTGGVGTVTVDVHRVDEMMAVVARRYPALAEPLAIMAIAVDGEIRQDADYVKLASESQVHFVPRIAGG